MKAAVILILLAGVGFFVMRSTLSSTDGFDPTEQGRQARETVESCANWTEVLDRAVPPQKWRNGASAFDFNYIDQYDETTREYIAKKLENKGLPYGFSFFYRFTDAITFAVNFDQKGNFNNIQDREGKGALMGG